MSSLLENINTQEIKIRVFFKHKIENFGFLVSETYKDIEAGTKVDVPLYIAQFLIENNHCTLANPILSEETENDLKANSSIINLNSLYKEFYKFIVNFKSNDFVLNIMFSRYTTLYKLILKEQLDEDDVFMLDNSEKKIIKMARKKYLMYREYFIKS
ncbi:DNA replication complex GINS protein PSF3-like [Vairimorpha necatrix]|uniref:DNA replication complex GINS protein PSF3 n=1 Tax=Vairimorpha necatrix TaxID=6039 RepID=A0AAX4J8E2_9MICR